MKILVTGAAGFIGSNICELLVEKGHAVVAIDNFDLGKMDNLKNIEGDIEFSECDIRDYDKLLELTKGCDAISNQAAASSSPMFMDKLHEAFDINVGGFINILNAAKENGVGKVVYVSTSSVYGNVPGVLNEKMHPFPPNFYAASKLSNEHLAVLFSQNYDVKTVGFRYMSVYGDHEKSKGKFANLVSQFLWEMQDGKSPVIYGDGTQSRDFVFAKDVARANLLAIEKDVNGEIINIGTGKPTNLLEMVGLINKVLGTDIKPEFVEIPVKNYIMSQVADVSKAESLLGFKSEYDLEKGIKEIVEHS